VTIFYVEFYSFVEIRCFRVHVLIRSPRFFLGNTSAHLICEIFATRLFWRKKIYRKQILYYYFNV